MERKIRELLNLDIDLLRAEKDNIWNMVYLQNAMLFTPVKMRNSS